MQVYRLPHLDHFCQETLLPYEREDKTLRTRDQRRYRIALSDYIISAARKNLSVETYAEKSKKTVTAVRRSTLAQ